MMTGTNPKPTPGISTPMPSSVRSLGPYVVLKPLSGGRGRAYFQVPARLRPHGWSPTIRLLADRPLADRVERLSDDDFAALVLAGAERRRALEMARTGSDSAPPRRSLQTLIDTWRRSTEWDGLTEKTREGYGWSIKKIQAWSDVTGHPDPTGLTRAGADRFLSTFNDRPTTKRQLKTALSLVMDQAVALGWRTDNPVRGIRVKVPKTKALIWEQADVDAYVQTALGQGMRSIALIVLLEWEIGQRLTDVRGFRPGREYDAERGVFSFEQSKTDAPVVIEISATLQVLLRELVDDEQLFLFRNERTGKAYTENRLSKTFGWVRHAVVKAGGRRLVLRQLRHSCIVQLARAGCTVPEIASITGHSIASVGRILSVYLPRDSTVARNAQMKRGIVRADENAA